MPCKNSGKVSRVAVLPSLRKDLSQSPRSPRSAVTFVSAECVCVVLLSTGPTHAEQWTHPSASFLPSVLTPDCQNRTVAMGTGSGKWGGRVLTYAFEGCGVIWEKLTEIEVQVAGLQVHIPWANAWKRNKTFIIRWLKSLERSKWPHDCTIHLIWMHLFGNICRHISISHLTKQAVKVCATVGAAAGQKWWWININALVTGQGSLHESSMVFTALLKY